MSTIVICIIEKHVAAFRHVVADQGLDVLQEQPANTFQGPAVRFTLDAGPGNTIQYFYLGLQWSERLRWEGGPAGG